MLIDTHAHIYTVDFTDDRDVVIQKAISAGIGKILMPNIDVASLPDVLHVADQYPGICYPLIGLHPGSVDARYKDQLNKLGEELGNHPFIGIGEIGIDLYWHQTFVEQQQDAFREQLRQARFNKLPVVIHVRESFSEVYSILKEEQDGSLNGIFHCFSGTENEARMITDLGFLMGIGGVVTYKNSRLPEALKHVELSQIVLETDAPWLTPVPNRGKRNECSYLTYIAQKVAEIYGLSPEEIAAATTRNTLEIFTFD
jgi:TatD DNase family protein